MSFIGFKWCTEEKLTMHQMTEKGLMDDMARQSLNVSDAVFILPVHELAKTNRDADNSNIIVE